MKAVDNVLNEFFHLADGVWIHNRVDREIARFVNARPAAEAKKENERERQRRARERRKSLFDELRSHGVSPAWDATTEWLQTELERVKNAPVTPPVTPPVTRDNTATQTPDPRHQTPIPKHAPLVNEEGGPVGPARASPAAVVCLAIRGEGVADANPSHPELLALVASGAGVDVFIDAAKQAVGKGKGFRYVLGTVKGRMEDAAKTAASKLSAMPVGGGVASTETAYQRSMRLRMQEVAPEAARRDPSFASASSAADFFEAIEVPARTMERIR